MMKGKKTIFGGQSAEFTFYLLNCRVKRLESILINVTIFTVKPGHLSSSRPGPPVENIT